MNFVFNYDLFLTCCDIHSCTKVQMEIRVFLLVLRCSPKRYCGPFSSSRRVSRTLVPWWVERIKSTMPSLARTHRRVYHSKTVEYKTASRPVWQFQSQSVSPKYCRFSTFQSFIHILWWVRDWISMHLKDSVRCCWSTPRLGLSDLIRIELQSQFDSLRLANHKRLLCESYINILT